jgi:hypothetical protein
MSIADLWNEPAGDVNDLAEGMSDAWDDFTDDPLGQLESWARDLVTSIEDLVSSFSVFDWVLLGLAAFFLVWIVASLRAVTRLGPIEVDPLEQDGAQTGTPPIAVKALTGALREKLDRVGLVPPPIVPAGSPRANLIAAVEASPMPESAFVAKLIELLPTPPRPLEYKLSGVLVGTKPAECSVTYWMRPSGGGKPLLETTPACHDHDRALSVAVATIYLHVTSDAPEAFPIWARWTNERSLRAYLEGCKARTDQRLEDAVSEFGRAQEMEQFNALVRLELANLYEATDPGAAALGRAHNQAHALCTYLDVAHDWPVLVEPRYRASIVASALATTCEALGESEQGEIRDHLAFDLNGEPELPTALRQIAARESTAVLQLLKPWYALLREKRLRNQFEPKAQERRRLGHAVSISKHCVRMRKLCGNPRLLANLEIRYRSFAVSWHLKTGIGALSWQAYYNASCFDALLRRHLDKRAVSASAEAPA